MLCIRHDLAVVKMADDGTMDDVLTELPQDGSKGDRPVVSCLRTTALLENRNDLSFFALGRNFALVDGCLEQ